MTCHGMNWRNVLIILLKHMIDRYNISLDNHYGNYASMIRNIVLENESFTDDFFTKEESDFLLRFLCIS